MFFNPCFIRNPCFLTRELVPVINPNPSNVAETHQKLVYYASIAGIAPHKLLSDDPAVRKHGLL